nr:squalene/phytoene synthase family protein [Parvularcula dongshanensis]
MLAGAEDWRLLLPYVEDEKRGGALTLLALGAELANAPARASEPPLAMIRFQWWREAVEEAFGDTQVRRHPLALAIETTLGAAPSMHSRLLSLVDGAEAVIDAAPPRTVQEALTLATPLYGRLGDALTDWLGASVTAGAGSALTLHAVATAKLSTPLQGRGLPRVADLIAQGETEGLAPQIEAQRREIRGLPAEVLPAALPFSLANAYAKGRRPGGLEKRARYLRVMLTGRF